MNYLDKELYEQAKQNVDAAGNFKNLRGFFIHQEYLQLGGRYRDTQPPAKKLPWGYALVLALLVLGALGRLITHY